MSTSGQGGYSTRWKRAWIRAEDFVFAASQTPVTLVRGVVAGLGVLALLFLAQLGVRGERVRLERELERLDGELEETSIALETSQYINWIRARDARKFKKALVSQAKMRKRFYEERLALSEEKRQLERQWDLLVTYLMLDPDAGRLKVMKGDQAVRSYLSGPLACLGAPKLKASSLSAITSKERFAHPERGKVELVEGKLAWTPPQVGPASRSVALGEHVLFTSSPLILHAPAKNRKEHEAYPHCCLPLTAAAAGRVYDSVFVGTRILLPEGSDRPSGARGGD